MHKYYVLGYWHTNLGDDLFLYLLSKKFPESLFFIFCDSKNYTVFKNLSNVRVLKKNNVLKLCNKILAKCQLQSFEDYYFKLKVNDVVEIGGSMFIEDKNWKRKFDRRNFLKKKMNQYFVIGSNFGPYKNDKFLNAYKNFFSSNVFTVFRDTVSKEYIQNNEIKVAPDTIFSIEKFVKDTEYIRSIKRKYVVISIIDLDSTTANRNEKIKNKKTAYESKMALVTEEFVKQGFDVVLMSFCEYEGDNDAIDKVFSILDTKVLKNVTKFIHTDIIDSLSIIHFSEKVIATRFHSMILGFVYKIPTLIISYSDKTDKTLSNLLNLENKAMSIDKFIDLPLSNIEKNFILMEESNLESVKEKSNEQFFFMEDKKVSYEQV